jgi:2-methylisocitrate lyase-like PEP mutase family enzyme
MGLVGGAFSVQQLAEAGVKRISLGSSLARAALGALVRAAREIRQEGTFGFAAQAIPFAEVNRQMRPKGA